MDVGYFIIAILGCAESVGAPCTPLMTVPTRYESESACAAAAPEALLANSDLDFPMLFAECRPGSTPAAAEKPAQVRNPLSSKA
jgi:hypothetical protein